MLSAYPTPFLQEIVQWFKPDWTGITIEPFGAGHINDTFLVKVGKNASQWVLQRINHLIFNEPEALMHNISMVARHLQQKKDYPMQILAPVANSEGQVCYAAPDGTFLRLFPLIENAITVLEGQTPGQAYQAAVAFGTCFRFLSDMPVHLIKVTIPRFHDTLYRYHQLEEAIGVNFQHRCEEASAEIAFLLQHKHFAFLFNELWEKGLPLRITHNDTKINNILLDPLTGKGRCVIDLDTLMPGTILSDFGDMVRTFTPNLLEDNHQTEALQGRKPVLEAMQNGFLDACSDVLMPIEKQHLFEGGLVIVYMQALRFLADYLRGDTYYKIHYPQHNLVRTRNQIALLKSLLAVGC